MEIMCSTEFTNIVKYNNHNFTINQNSTGDIISQIKFQHGKITDEPMNGILLMDVLNVARLILHGFQGTEFRCRENSDALSYLNNAMRVLEERQDRRKKQGKFNDPSKAGFEDE